MTSASLTCLALSYTVLISGDDDDDHGDGENGKCLLTHTMINDYDGAGDHDDDGHGDDDGDDHWDDDDHRSHHS